jgi:hypothetical protein
MDGFSSGGGVADSFLTSPSYWSLGDRLVLNGRRAFLGPTSKRQIQSQHPCQ